MDRDLVEAARNGDREAYVDLIRARSDRLFAIAQRILRDIDRAEDALQDALVIAWRDLKSLRDPDRFDAWLQRLVINVCIAQATRERRRTANLRVLPAVTDRRSRRPAQRGRPGRARARIPTAAARTAGDPRPAPLSRVCSLGDRRDPRNPRRDGPFTAVPRASGDAGRTRRRSTNHDRAGATGMTQQRDIERLLDALFSEGPTVGSDRLIHVVADRIQREPQRASWHMRWGRSRRTADVRLAIVGLAALVLAAIVGLGVMGQLPSVVPPLPSLLRPTAEASTRPSPRPSVPPEAPFRSARVRSSSST